MKGEASDYDRRWEAYLAATGGETVARIQVHPGDRVLDVGCGTGRLLARLAEVGGEVGGGAGDGHRDGGGPTGDPTRARFLTGVDLNAGMLAVARRRLPPTTRLVQARAGALPFAKESFDLAVSSSSLHFRSRPREGLVEIARVLRPGGRLVVTDWCRDFWIQALRELYMGRLDPAHHQTYTMAELREMLEAVGFRSVSLERYRALATWGMMTARAVKDR